MLKIAHVQQLKSINSLPNEVMNTIREAVTILDNEYGENRDIDSGYGGYVLVIETQEELMILQELQIDITNVIPEYVEVIHCQSREFFASSLILLGILMGSGLSYAKKLTYSNGLLS